MIVDSTALYVVGNIGGVNKTLIHTSLRTIHMGDLAPFIWKSNLVQFFKLCISF